MTDNSDLRNLANCIRFLTIDAVQKANSGHPGMPMGMADVATILFTEFLNFDIKNSNWINRDRFVLSAGHGSMLLYSLFYLLGYDDISIDDLKNFRQLHSKTAGHPEKGELKAIETTTGPLGQGLGNAVGMSIAQNILSAKFGKKIFNHKTYAIVGDGCLMEGISYEAVSLAGHLQLKDLILLWDDNSISIDGDVSLASSENMKMRFEASNWAFISIDGHNFEEIRAALKNAKNSDKPTLIACKTIIGYGSPNKAGSEKCHGSALGIEEVENVRKKLNWKSAPFEIEENLLKKWRKFGERNSVFNQWNQALSDDDKNKLKIFFDNNYLKNIGQDFEKFKEEIFEKKENIATRKASQNVLEFLTSKIPNLIGGSADLTESVFTKTSHTKKIDKNNFSGSYIHYGIREHSMGAIANGMALYGGILPYIGTFLVFSDYMRPAIRLACLMKLQLIYIFTHDSIGLGEDGPTHQPVEHIASLQAIPGLNVIRPADAFETAIAFEIALEEKKSPSAIILSRQNLQFLNIKKINAKKGAYKLFEIKNPQVEIYASGSEVEIAVKTREILLQKNISCEIISFLSASIFDKQDENYKKEILKNKNSIKVAIEAGVGQNWYKYIGNDGIFIGMKNFGASAKASDLYKYFEITAENAVEEILKKL